MIADFLIYSAQNQLGGVTEYSLYETVQVVPNITELEEGIQYTIAYYNTDPERINSNTTTYGFTDSTDQDNLAYSILLNKLGVYTITIVITNLSNGLSNTYTETISTSEFITFEYNQCDSFIINNTSTTKDATFYVTTIDNTSVIESTSLEASTSTTVTFDSMGLYIINVDYTDSNDEIIHYEYVLNTFCMIDDCLSKFILDLLCEDTRDCTCEFEPSHQIRIIRMFALKETYFMKLQSEYGFNNKYSALTDSKLNELTTISQVLEKLSMMCDRTYCLEGDCAGIASVTGYNVNTGCGCS